MRIERTFLKSRVARRIFGLFFITALLPVSILGILTYVQVESSLTEQSQARLNEISKVTALEMVGKLDFLRSELQLLASQLRTTNSHEGLRDSNSRSQSLEDRFSGLVLLAENMKQIPLFGKVGAYPTPTSEQVDHLETGESLLMALARADESGRFLMWQKVDPNGPGSEILLGEIDIHYLLNIDDGGSFSSRSEVFVFSESKELLYSSLPISDELNDLVISRYSKSDSGDFEWNWDDQEYQAGSRPVPLGYQYHEPALIVVISESRAVTFAAVETFRKTFPFVVLASLLLVSLLSTTQIRRSLIPLEKLKEGTKQIADAKFETKVEVTSGDEFQDLANSFNTMAVQLGRQFNTLATVGEIDRAILSALKTDEVIGTVLKRIPDLFGTARVGLTILDKAAGDRARTYIGQGRDSTASVIEHIGLSQEHLSRVASTPKGVIIDPLEHEVPSYLTPLASQGIGSFVIRPILVRKELAGMLCLGFSNRSDLTEDVWAQIDQLSNQVAVAFSNARLLEELHELNWSTLEALARTVDAKSRWTAGHSHRVTNLALRIGRRMGLSEKELEVIHRGGLLHDIGKIGIPARILDKPGRLTNDEYETIKLHPSIGARILEPVKAYQDVIPIVLHHHERMDGKGYPEGLMGDEIRIDVRVVAVADVFDAIFSDRPYRPRKSLDKVASIIQAGSGAHFAPEVVKAFMHLVNEERDSFISEQASTSAEEYLPSQIAESLVRR